MTRRQFVYAAVAVTAATSSARSSPLVALRRTAPFRDLPESAWTRARQNGLVMFWPDPPAHLTREARIAAGEPGEPLIVDGQVFTPDGVSPAAGVTVYAYNTDAEGYYGANHTDYPPRLHGWMLTDRSGGFQLHTIRPGHYPRMRVAAHIHFSLWGGGLPLQWVDELRFAGDPYLTEPAGGGKFSTIQPVTRGDDGVWHCAFHIRAGRACNFR